MKIKKLISAVLFAMLGVGSCFAAGEKNIYCMTYPVWLLTRELTAGAKDVRTQLMIPAGTGCPHEYVMTPGDMRKLGAGNLIVVRNGLGLDDFVLRPLKKVNPSARIITACSGLEKICLKGQNRKAHTVHSAEATHKHTEKCKHTHKHHGEEEAMFNPHLFASPDTAVAMAEVIVAGLTGFDPENAALYRRNMKYLRRNAELLMKEIRDLRPLVRGKHIVVQHGVFDYLARALDLHIAAEISAEGNVPSAAEMRALVQVIGKEKVAVIFTEPQYPSRTAETLAKECRIKVCQLDPVASGPADPGKDYYWKMMKENLKKIRRVLAR